MSVNDGVIKSAVGFGPMQVDWETRIDQERLRQDRLRKTRQEMERASADYLIQLRLENARYSLGVKRVHWPTLHIGGGPLVVLAQDADPALWILDPDYVHGNLPWIPRKRVHDTYMMDVEADVQRFTRDLLDDFGSKIETSRIAVDIWSPAMFSALQAAFPRAQFIDGQDIMLKARSIKTPEEINCMKLAYAISEAGMQAAVDILRPGVRECELVGACLKRMSDFGSEVSQCSETLNSGPGTYPYRRFHTDRIVQHGELVNMDFGGCFNGYFGDFARTFVVGGKPTPMQRDLIRRANEMQQQTLADLRPGVTASDLCRKQGRRIIAHGLGISAFEAPHIREVDDYEIKPGMTFSLITPPVGEDGIGGVHLEDEVVVTETGVDLYSTYPQDYVD